MNPMFFSERDWYVIGGAIFTTLFVVFACRFVKNFSGKTAASAPVTVPTKIIGQRIRESSLKRNQIMFCVRLAYIAAGHGIGYSPVLRERVLKELFDEAAVQAFAAEFNRLMRISPRFLLGEYPMQTASPLTTQAMIDNDELMTFLATYVDVLQRLHGRILWGTPFGYEPGIAWIEVDETFRQLANIYAEHTNLPERV